MEKRGSCLIRVQEWVPLEDNAIILTKFKYLPGELRSPSRNSPPRDQAPTLYTSSVLSLPETLRRPIAAAWSVRTSSKMFGLEPHKHSPG